MTLGAIIGRVDLLNVIPTDRPGFVQTLSDQEQAFGNYQPKRFAWKFAL